MRAELTVGRFPNLLSIQSIFFLFFHPNGRWNISELERRSNHNCITMAELVIRPDKLEFHDLVDLVDLVADRDSMGFTLNQIRGFFKTG